MDTLDTDISVERPKDIYSCIVPRSGLTHRYQLNVLGGVIDDNYRDRIKVMLQNLGRQLVSITRGQNISHMICGHATIPHIYDITSLTTVRDTKNIGNTETCSPKVLYHKASQVPTPLITNHDPSPVPTQSSTSKGHTSPNIVRDDTSESNENIDDNDDTTIDIPHLNSCYDIDSSDGNSIYNNMYLMNLVPFQEHEVTNRIP